MLVRRPSPAQLEPPREAGVEPRPPGLQQAPVGDVPSQHVRSRTRSRRRSMKPLPMAARSRVPPAGRTRPRLQLEQPGDELAREGRAPSPRRPAVPPSRVALEQVDASREDGLHRVGDDHIPHRLDRAVRSLVDQGPQHSRTKRGFPSATTTASRKGRRQLGGKQICLLGAGCVGLGQGLQPERPGRRATPPGWATTARPRAAQCRAAGGRAPPAGRLEQATRGLLPECRLLD